MLIRNITSSRDLENKKRLQAEMLQAQIDNEKILDERVRDYKNPNKPPAVPPQYKSNSEVLADSLEQQKEAIENLRSLGLGFDVAAQTSIELKNLPDGIANLVKLNKNFPFIKTDILKRYNVKLLDPKVLIEYFKEYFDNIDNIIGISIPSTSSTNYFDKGVSTSLIATNDDYKRLNAALEIVFDRTNINKNQIDELKSANDRMASISPTDAELQSINTFDAITRNKLKKEMEKLMLRYPSGKSINEITDNLTNQIKEDGIDTFALANAKAGGIDVKQQTPESVINNLSILRRLLKNIPVLMKPLSDFTEKLKGQEDELKQKESDFYEKYDTGEESKGQELTEIKIPKEIVEQQEKALKDIVKHRQNIELLNKVKAEKLKEKITPFTPKKSVEQADIDKELDLFVKREEEELEKQFKIQSEELMNSLTTQKNRFDKFKSIAESEGEGKLTANQLDEMRRLYASIKRTTDELKNLKEMREDFKNKIMEKVKEKRNELLSADVSSSVNKEDLRKKIKLLKTELREKENMRNEGAFQDENSTVRKTLEKQIQILKNNIDSLVDEVKPYQEKKKLVKEVNKNLTNEEKKLKEAEEVLLKKQKEAMIEPRNTSREEKKKYLDKKIAGLKHYNLNQRLVNEEDIYKEEYLLQVPTTDFKRPNKNKDNVIFEGYIDENGVFQKFTPPITKDGYEYNVDYPYNRFLLRASVSSKNKNGEVTGSNIESNYRYPDEGIRDMIKEYEIEPLKARIDNDEDYDPRQEKYQRRVTDGFGLTNNIIKHFNKDNKDMEKLSKSLKKHLKVEEKVDAPKKKGGSANFSARRIKIGKGLSPMEKEPIHKEFGKYIINMRQLKSGYLNLKHPSGSQIPSIPTVEVSKNYREFVLDVLENSKVNQRHYDILTNPEKAHFTNITKKAKLFDVLDFKAEENEEEKKDLERLELLFGEYNAGNDNPKMIKECKALIKKYIANGRIEQSRGLNMLMELD